MQQGRQVAEHPLQTHVLGLTGCFDFSTHMEVPNAAIQFGDGHRRIKAFADIQRIPALVGLRHDGPAEGDQLPGNARYAPRQQSRRSEHRQAPKRHAPPLHANSSPREHAQAPERGQGDEHALGVLRAQPPHKKQAGRQGAQDGADGVSGIDSSDESPWFSSLRWHGRQRQWKARTPQASRREKRPQATGAGRAGS